MKPNQIKWYLGSYTLAMVMEQERKHWLLKTDKNLQVQDKVTGDIFHGRIDNLGSDIIIETEKLPLIDKLVRGAKLDTIELQNALELGSSQFPYIPELNGLTMLRVKSINVDITPVSTQAYEPQHLNYRMRLRDCTIVAVPISTNGGDVFVYRWIRTTTKPEIELYNPSTQTYLDQVIQISFESPSDENPDIVEINNPVYYYPLDNILQPFSITPDDDETATEFVTELISDPEMIGNTLVWFTCDESDTGAKCVITNNRTASYGKALTMGYNNNGSRYEQLVYPCVGPLYFNAPRAIDQGEESNEHYWIRCYAGDVSFTGDLESDCNIPIKKVEFVYSLDGTGDANVVEIPWDNTEHGTNIWKMVSNEQWIYGNNCYTIQLSNFDSNALVSGADERDPLIPVFRVQLDQTIPFDATTTDVGYAGMRFGSSKNYADQFPRYPHDIEKMDGLPEWVRETDEHSSPQHLSVYAIHNTPNYKPEVQESRQIAGLIFDPGVERDYETKLVVGRYRIKNVTIVNKGTGYMPDFDSPVDPGGTYSRVRIRFTNNLLSTLTLMIVSVDDNGGVTAVEPLYYDEGDPIGNPETRPYFYEYYMVEGGLVRIKQNTTYADGDRSLVPDNVRSQLWYISHIEDGRAYLTKNEIKTETLNRYVNTSDLMTGGVSNPFEASWDPNELTGFSLDTEWSTTRYSVELLKNARELDPYGHQPMSELGGDPDDGMIWEYYTTAIGVGLKVKIELEDIEEVTPPRSAADIPTEEIGRVYMLSNDDIEYHNNAKLKQPKPPRTIARICDIPTSIVQLTNIQGIAPTAVVDKKYVRTEAPFTDNDLYRLYNGVRDRWVRPIHKDRLGHQIFSEDGTGTYVQTNRFIFDSVDNLNAVDLNYYNDFRVYENLNAKVDPADVHVASIVQPGTGYEVGSSGVVIVGGYSFEYQVIRVNDSGGVVEVGIAPPSGSTIGLTLSTFDLDETNPGYTLPYGTSPLENQAGTGLKIRLMIDHYDQLLPRRGKIIEGLHAFVKERGGIWMYEYNTSGETGWRQFQQISEISEADTTSDDGLSVRESFLNSLLPSVRMLPSQQYTAERPESTVRVLQTAGCLNVIDNLTTPVRLPSNSGDTISRTVIDINKFYCRELSTLTAETKSIDGVIKALKANGKDYFDVTIFWKWVNDHDSSNKQFRYGIIRRSFNNLFTTDTSSHLPSNELVNKKFVHTNSGTMIMWNVPQVGPMVWVFNPTSTTHETYYVDTDTRELCVVRKPFHWNDVEILDAQNHVIPDMRLYDTTTNQLLWNILTNSPTYANPGISQSPIYQQPDFMYFYQDIQSMIPEPDKGPIGTWELVFPQVHSFTFRNNQTGQNNYAPVRMQVIRGTNLPLENNDILNERGENVSYRTLVIEEPAEGRAKLKAFNKNNNTWEEL